MSIVLIVEDELETRTALRSILEAEGHQTLAVGTLLEARRMLSVRSVACVVTDLVLPDGSAESLLEELSEAPSSPAAVVVSGARDATPIARVYGIAAISKPFDGDVLLAAVNVAIAQAAKPTRRLRAITPRSAR